MRGPEEVYAFFNFLREGSQAITRETECYEMRHGGIGMSRQAQPFTMDTMVRVRRFTPPRADRVDCGECGWDTGSGEGGGRPHHPLG